MSHGKWLQPILGLALTLSFVVGCSAPTATPEPTSTFTPTLIPSTTFTFTPTLVPSTTTPTPSPEVLTLLAWIDAFNRRDIDACMSYVADEAVLDRGPHGIVTGAEAIRATLLVEFEKPIKAYVTWWSVDGGAVTYGSYVTVEGQRIDSCTSLMLIENGKIVSDLCAP